MEVVKEIVRQLHLAPNICQSISHCPQYSSPTKITHLHPEVLYPWAPQRQPMNLPKGVRALLT